MVITAIITTLFILFFLFLKKHFLFSLPSNNNHSDYYSVYYNLFPFLFFFLYFAITHGYPGLAWAAHGYPWVISTPTSGRPPIRRPPGANPTPSIYSHPGQPLPIGEYPELIIIYVRVCSKESVPSTSGNPTPGCSCGPKISGSQSQCSAVSAIDGCAGFGTCRRSAPAGDRHLQEIGTCRRSADDQM